MSSTHHSVNISRITKLKRAVKNEQTNDGMDNIIRFIIKFKKEKWKRFELVRQVLSNASRTGFSNLISTTSRTQWKSNLIVCVCVTWMRSSSRSCAASGGRTTALCRDGPIPDRVHRRSDRPNRFLLRRQRPESESSSTGAWNWTCDSTWNAELLLHSQHVWKAKTINNK